MGNKIKTVKKGNLAFRTKKYWYRNWQLWVMLFPAMLYILIFCYVPMYGVQLAFRDYSFATGITGAIGQDLSILNSILTVRCFLQH